MSEATAWLKHPGIVAVELDLPLSGSMVLSAKTSLSLVVTNGAMLHSGVLQPEFLQDLELDVRLDNGLVTVLVRLLEGCVNLRRLSLHCRWREHGGLSVGNANRLLSAVGRLARSPRSPHVYLRPDLDMAQWMAVHCGPFQALRKLPNVLLLNLPPFIAPLLSSLTL